MSWHAQLDLHYTVEDARTVLRFAHTGPLRVLQSLYPEGPGVCHNVLVHPPGGLVGGDTLEVHAQVAAGAHALITTPGATRFYRSEGATALQLTRLAVAEGARLEWLPLESLCYSACQAENHLTLQLAPGAESMAWDVTALGLPHARQPFAAGRVLQHLELPGVWLERGVIDAADQRLLTSPLGLAGHTTLATLVLATGTALDRTRREQALGVARAVLQAHPLAATAGATSPHPQVVVVRTLAHQVAPAMQLMKALRAAWRTALWDLPATVPRTWAL